MPRSPLGPAIVRALLVLAATGTAGHGFASCPAGSDAGWCRAFDGPDGLPDTPDDDVRCKAGAVAGWGTSCDTHAATEWRMGQSETCADCTYDWYVRIGCGRQLSLRFDGTQAVSLTITNVETGEPARLSAWNQCLEPNLYATEGPVRYCDGCGFHGALYTMGEAVPAIGKPEGTCTATVPFPHDMDEVPCMPWISRGLEAHWGRPVDADGDGVYDEDGDGMIDETEGAPCTPCEPPACPCGMTTTRNRWLLGQRIHVRSEGATPGVYRIRVRGGGPDWTISANCELHDGCSAAEALPAGSAGLPQLAFALDAVSAVEPVRCPDAVRAAITVCNHGDAPALTVPILLPFPIPGVRFDLAAHPTDPDCQGPLPPGDCRRCEYDLPTTAGFVQLDPDDDVPECFEAAPGPCRTHPDALRFNLCPEAGGCRIFAALAVAPTACVGRTLLLDASGSAADSCTSSLEARFEADGVPIPGCDWSPSLTCDFDVTAAGSLRVEAYVRCAAEPACEGSWARSVEAETPPDFPSALRVAPEGECALRVEWDEATLAPVAGYDVYRGGAVPVPLDAAHRVAAGLTATTWLDAAPWGTPWRYRVEAVNACARVPNGGGDSAPVSVPDDDAPVFAGVVNTRDLGACQVEVTWGAGSDACSGIAGFNVYRDHGVAHAGETLVAAGVPGSPHVDTTPGNGTWVYVVRAVDRAGNEDPNAVFQQESEGSCTNDFPGDAGMDEEEGIDSPNADRLRVRRGALADGLRIRWNPSVDERGLYPVTYAIHRGSLRSLTRDGYTHELLAPDACGIAIHEYTAMDQDDGVDSYYLVAAVSGDNVTFGYDSSGARLPGRPCP